MRSPGSWFHGKLKIRMVLLICILLTVLCFSLSANGKNEKSMLNNIDCMSISGGPSEFLQLLSVHVSPNTFPFTRNAHLSISSDLSCFLSCMLFCFLVRTQKPLLRAFPSIILKASLGVWLVFAAYVQEQAESIWCSLYRVVWRKAMI